MGFQCKGLCTRPENKPTKRAIRMWHESPYSIAGTRRCRCCCVYLQIDEEKNPQSKCPCCGMKMAAVSRYNRQDRLARKRERAEREKEENNIMII